MRNQKIGTTQKETYGNLKQYHLWNSEMDGKKSKSEFNLNKYLPARRKYIVEFNKMIDALVLRTLVFPTLRDIVRVYFLN